MQHTVEPTQALAALVAVLLVGAVVLGIMLARAYVANRRLRFEVERAKGASQSVVAPLRRMERDLDFVTQFVREFPRILARLGSCSQIREIPEVLVHSVQETFAAEQAIVLLRRKRTLRAPERDRYLIVAAVAVEEPGLEVGSEIPLGEGELGFVGEAQRAMDARDFADETAVNREHIRQGGHLPLDAAAPLVVGDRTLGVVAFARAARSVPRAKEMLQAIAQLGALTLHNLSAYRQVRVAADLDGLTGILNKRALKLRLSEHIYRAGEKGTPVSIFLFDIDHFKNYNDRNGHVAGDEALRLVARLAAETVRADDVFGRFGGEEFLVILPGRTAGEAMVAARGIRRAVEEHDFPFGDGQPGGRLTISGGVAAFPDDGPDSVDLLKAADVALYRAKESGRNRVEAAVTGLGG